MVICSYFLLSGVHPSLSRRRPRRTASPRLKSQLDHCRCPATPRVHESRPTPRAWISSGPGETQGNAHRQREAVAVVPEGSKQDYAVAAGRWGPKQRRPDPRSFACFGNVMPKGSAYVSGYGPCGPRGCGVPGAARNQQPTVTCKESRTTGEAQDRLLGRGCPEFLWDLGLRRRTGGRLRCGWPRRSCSSTT